MSTSPNQAIQAALNQNWDEAVEINQTLLAEKPNDVATLNRLAFAFRQLGQIKKAKLTYLKVLKLDHYNPIAKKSLEKLSQLKPLSHKQENQKVITTFLEEPGKTKTVSLVRPAASEVIVNLLPGTQVNLVSKKRRVSVETNSRLYIGCLPDDLGFRLGKLIGLGYKYQTIIKTTDNKSVLIFIKEMERSKRGKNLPSFSSTPSSRFSPPQSQLLDEIPIDTTPTGEEDEMNTE